MFTFFKSRAINKLDKKYEEKLEQAMRAQRNGDIKSYAMITEQAEIINSKVKALKEEIDK